MKKKSEKDNADLTKITNFTLANTLVCLGQEILLINLDKGDPSKTEFVFDKNEMIERLTKAYFNGNLLVEPKKFLDMRNQIHDRIRNLSAE